MKNKALFTGIALATGLSLSPVTHAAVLYSQLSNPGAGTTSQDFETAYDAYDNAGADDFVVTGTGWNISEFYFPGLGNTFGAGAFDIAIYSNASGLPGGAVVTLDNVPFVVTGQGDITATLAAPVTLAAGTYWLSGVAELAFVADGQWFWGSRLVQTGFASAWRNPGDGFGTGCTTWGTQVGCLGTGPDFLFEIRGTTVPEPMTLSLLGLGLAGIGVMRRKKLAA